LFIEERHEPECSPEEDEDGKWDDQVLGPADAKPADSIGEEIIHQEVRQRMRDDQSGNLVVEHQNGKPGVIQMAGQIGRLNVDLPETRDEDADAAQSD
jgi:hypothetical protein